MVNMLSIYKQNPVTGVQSEVDKAGTSNRPINIVTLLPGLGSHK